LLAVLFAAPSLAPHPTPADPASNTTNTPERNPRPDLTTQEWRTLSIWVRRRNLAPQSSARGEASAPRPPIAPAGSSLRTQLRKKAWLTERSDAEHVGRFAVHRRVEALLRFGADADWRDEVDDVEHHVCETKGV
jgi:hypothetical protein